MENNDTAMGFTCPQHGTKYGYCEECLFPKAPEPTGDDTLFCKLCGDTFNDHYSLGSRKVCYNKDPQKMAIITGNYFTPPVEPPTGDGAEVWITCKRCGKRIIDDGFPCDWCANGAKPKAPEDIELPPLPEKLRHWEWVEYWRDVALPARESQLKAKVAANRIWRYGYWEVRQERDAALEEVDVFRSSLAATVEGETVLIAERDQLQRDLDYVRRDSDKAYQEQWARAEKAERDLDEAKGVISGERENSFHSQHTAQREYKYSDGIYIHTCHFCKSADGLNGNRGRKRMIDAEIWMIRARQGKRKKWLVFDESGPYGSIESAQAHCEAWAENPLGITYEPVKFVESK